MRRLYCICAASVFLAGPAKAGHYAGPAGAGHYVLAQQAQPPSTAYLIFLRGAPIGREDVTVQTDASGTTIRSQGRLSAPFNAITRRAEFRYRLDWSPESFVLEGTANGGEVEIRTSFSNGIATSQGTQSGKQVSASHPVAPQVVILPNGIFSAFSALALRLTTATPGAELRAYVLPLMEIPVRVGAVHTEQIQLGASILNVRRYDLSFANPGGDLAVNLTATESGSLLRVNIAAQALDVVRDDVAASTSRAQIFSNPGDEPVTIPASGFNLGATLTRPRGGGPSGPPAQGRLPAVILLSGSGVGDRDGFALGIPTLGQLAGAIADAGILAVRYDKRGHGQSGGRSESATLSDYAEDARAVIRWLANRKDVDQKRIALVGHSEGAWVALLAASRERRVAAVASIAGPGTRGAELILEQQQHALEQLNLPPAERESRVALQKQIQAAVLTGKGWEGVPPELRRQADTPWFQSVLAFDPAKVVDDVRQPLLFVHGELDRQVPVAHADRLADLARKESDSKAVEVVIVRGVNHLLVPAKTGEPAEYGSLEDRNISKDVTMAITGWLSKTFAAIR